MSDIKRLTEGEGFFSTSTQNSTIVHKKVNTFDWKLNAIQQLGIFLSQRFSSVKESFEKLSEGLNKINVAQFRAFLDTTRALHGFDLSNQLQYELFTEIDPHKKGFITENDWSNAFKAYAWTDQALSELKNQISCNFPSYEDAFLYFASYI